MDNFGKDRGKRDGLTLWCKGCQKAYREQNSERIRDYHRRRYVENNEYYVEYRRNNADAIKAYNQFYHAQKLEWYNRRREEDPTFKMSTNLRNLLRQGLKRGRITKTTSAGTLLGMDFEEFHRWLEFQFEPWMSWDNYGQWQIDHVLPVSRFDLADDAQQRVCFHWSNMRPMCAKANNSKNNAIVLHDYFNCLISAHRFIQKQGLGRQEYQALRESLAWLRAKI